MPHASPAPDRLNDFVIKLANVNGTGSASANSLLMKSIFRSGIPVMGKNYFPSNIQGLPTWYEIRVTKDGYVARSAGTAAITVSCRGRRGEVSARLDEEALAAAEAFCLELIDRIDGELGPELPAADAALSER